jgi:hypothetical protein
VGVHTGRLRAAATVKKLPIETFYLELPPSEPLSKQQYTTHKYFRYFMSMVDRARRYAIDCKFTWGLNELNGWLEVPTVGRYDHSKGYVFDTENNRWNFRWQERSENSREAGLTSGWGAATFEQRSKAGRKAAELGKTGFQTGVARTGVAQKASVASPKNRQVIICPNCGKIGKVLE